MDRSLLAVVAVAVLVAAPGLGGAAVGVVDAPGRAASDATTQDSGTVEVSTGSQLSTVLAATEDDVGAGVSESVFEARFRSGNETERARAVADRAAALRAAAAALRADYREATAAFRNGSLDRSTYAQRLATLNARAENVGSSVVDLRTRAANVSELELQSAGYDGTALDAATADLDAVSGTAPAALRERFTGQSNGTVRVDAGEGVAVEVEREDGERALEVRSPGDGNASMTVDQGAALSTARAALSDRAWTLREAEVDADDGRYAFEFGLATANETGEAEVAVDGSAGAVLRVEESVEPREEGDDAAPEEREDERGELVVLVVAGDPAPGETVTVETRRSGDPVDAAVRVDGERVGTTGDDGRIDVTLAGEETEVRAEHDGGEAELAFEFETEDRPESLGLAASLADGTVTVTVSYEGDPVPGAQVDIDGERVGTTGDDGTVSFARDGSTALDVEATRGDLEAERTYRVENGSLVSDGDDDGKNESEGGEDREERSDSLTLAVVDGDPAPNATVTIEVRRDGTPVSGAGVAVDGERVGTTGDDGRIDVTLTGEETEVRAERGDAEGEREFEFEFESEGEDDEDGSETETGTPGNGSRDPGGEDPHGGEGDESDTDDEGNEGDGTESGEERAENGDGGESDGDEMEDSDDGTGDEDDSEETEDSDDGDGDDDDTDDSDGETEGDG